MRCKHFTPKVLLSLACLIATEVVPCGASTDKSKVVEASVKIKTTSVPGNDAKSAEKLFSRANLLAAQQQYDQAIKTYVDSYLANWHNPKQGEKCSSQLVALAGKLDPERSLHAYRMAVFCHRLNRSAVAGHGALLRGDADNPVELEKLADACLAKGDRFGALVEYSASIERANNAEVRKKYKKVLSECGLPTWPLQWSENSTLNYAPFMQVMQSWIRAAWQMDEISNPSSYRVRLSWTVGQNGELSDLKVDKSSGNANLDAVALNAVRLAAPYRKPPKSAVEKIDVEFTFDYNYSAESHRTNGVSPYRATIIKAKTAMEAGKFSEAAHILEEAEQSASGQMMALIQGKLVDALLMQASLPTVSARDALQLIRQAYRREPDNPEVLAKLHEAIKAIGKDPNSFQDRVTMGDECMESREFESAAAEYKAAVALQDGPEIRTKLSAAESKVKALKNLERWKVFAAKNPKSIDAQLTIGRSCKDLGDKEQAIAAYKKVLELDPLNVSAKGAIDELSPPQSP